MASSLSEQIDQLSRNAKSIRSIASKTGFRDDGERTSAAIAGPFTRAVLYKSLGDLIRDIDPSELGLFHLITPPGPGTNRSNERDARGGVNPEITRVEFPGATPLRQPARKDDTQKPKELEPEVYAQAALKYLDRYEPIRPMPRAHASVASITERVTAVRDSINNLSITLEEITSAESQTSPKNRADEEESQIQKIKSKILELQKQKEVLLKKQGRPGIKPSRAPIKQKPMSFSSPVPPPTVASPPRHSHIAEPESPISAEILEIQENIVPESGLATPETRPETKSLEVRLPETRSSETRSPDTRSPETEPTAQPETPSGPKRLKVRVNSEVERVVSKIWSTVGEIIMPGNSFNSSGPGGPPKAKETIAHLQSLASQTPAPLSPSISSESSLSVALRGPTSQQILTAHLLLILLSSTPNFSLPLNKIKDELASKAGGTAAALGVGSTRVLYGCVAKRLVKIERGGGEQVVRFDL